MNASAEAKARRVGFIITVLIGSVIGIVWDVLTALVLFRSYSFFESVVVCLMILSSIATMRADELPFLFNRVQLFRAGLRQARQCSPQCRSHTAWLGIRLVF